MNQHDRNLAGLVGIDGVYTCSRGIDLRIEQPEILIAFASGVGLADAATVGGWMMNAPPLVPGG